MFIIHFSLISAKLISKLTQGRDLLWKLASYFERKMKNRITKKNYKKIGYLSRIFFERLWFAFIQACRFICMSALK